MSSSSDKKTRLFRIRKTIGKMLNARGYMVGQNELDLERDAFVEEHGEDPQRANLTMQFPRRDDPADSIFVFFPDEEKVGVKTIKEYAKRMKDESVFRAIIVVQQSLTPFAKQSLLECQAQNSTSSSSRSRSSSSTSPTTCWCPSTFSSTMSRRRPSSSGTR